MINKQPIMARGLRRSEKKEVKVLVVGKGMQDRYLDPLRFSLL